MSNKSINSLLGPLSTKELPSSGRPQTNNNVIRKNHNEDSFHAKLKKSMENNQTSDRHTNTDIPSESNSIKNTQTADERTSTDIPPESISTENTQTSDEQVVTNGNQAQLNTEDNQNIHENEFTNAIINKISNYKTSTAPIETNTVLENPLLNNMELKSPGGPNSNITQKQTGDLTPEPAAALSGKLNTTQVTTNISQQIPVDTEQEQLQTSLSDKLKTVQNNTKIGEQRILDIISSPGLSEAATGSKGEESIPQLSKLSTEQSIATSENDVNKNLSKANITGNKDTVPTTEKAGLNPMPDAHNVSHSKIIDLNIPSDTDEISNNKINEMLKKQIQGKPLSPKADNNQQTQQGVAQTQIEGEETPKIFEVSANTTENKAGKLFDNTTITSSNDAKTVESVMTPNTSSDNSAFNNQGANTDFDFSSNTVNNNQKTRPETNFNNTLSQINNSAKPLGTIGNDVADNIIQSAKLYTQGGKSEVKVQLSPPELGTIKLEFKVEDNVLETKITVERSSVKDVIEKDISRLRELISNADIDVGKLDVSLQDNENNKMDFMNKDFQSNSKSKSPQNLSQEESESNEGNLDEEPISNNRESTQINYLV